MITTIKSILMLLVLIVFNTVFASTKESLSGPDLTSDINGLFNSGLQLTAKKEIVLESFIFQNRGLPDTISLKNEVGDTLETYIYPGGDTSHLINANWLLEAGQTYFLLSETRSNGKWIEYSSFPDMNEHIQVDGTYTSNNLKTSFWFNFTDFTTVSNDGSNDSFPFNSVDGLGIRAEINTVEKGIVEAVWSKGGEANTARGDKVIWGHFYANPADVSWGSVNNPDLYVKIWFDVNGRIDVNYFHVSVPEINVYTASSSTASSPDESGITNLDTRYIRHSFDQDGFSFSEENFEDGIPPSNDIYSPDPVGVQIDNNIHIGARINTVEAGLIEGIWQKGGQSLTTRGDEVVWGYFSADPNLVGWGNPENPEIFVKIWFDVSGRIDVNYFHVSVPEIGVYSAHLNDIDYDQRGITILEDRYTRHEFQLQ